MQPIDNVTQVMQVLRRQMAENLERMRSDGKVAGNATPTGAAAPRRTTPTLRQSVARRVKSIDPDDPRFVEKATQLFVESVLLAEFGEERVNEPKFRDLILQVRTAMLSNAPLQAELARMAAGLRRS